MTLPPDVPATGPGHELAEDVQDLLNTERELNAEEQRTLRTLATAGWNQVTRILGRNADRAYAMSSPQEFGQCVFGHMSISARAELTLAEVYQCPVCGRLLKDRNNPVASSILLERRRLREKWAQVEAANVDEKAAALDSFRAALGYEPPSEPEKA